MLREMEELRSLAIGSPVPTPQPDDEGLFVESPLTESDDGGKFGINNDLCPKIRVERCLPAAAAAEGSSGTSDESGRSSSAAANEEQETLSAITTSASRQNGRKAEEIKTSADCDGGSRG